MGLRSARTHMPRGMLPGSKISWTYTFSRMMPQVRPMAQKNAVRWLFMMERRSGSGECVYHQASRA